MTVGTCSWEICPSSSVNLSVKASRRGVAARRVFVLKKLLSASSCTCSTMVTLSAQFSTLSLASCGASY